MGKMKSVSERNYGVFIRIEDEYDKMLKFVAGVERKSNAEIAKSILQPGLKKRYETCLQEFKKSL